MEKTYELWFMGDFFREGKHNRETYQSMIDEGLQMLKDSVAVGGNWGSAEICSRLGHGADTAWEMNHDQFKTGKPYILR